MMPNKPTKSIHAPHLITTGDPAGIGMDIVLLTLTHQGFLQTLTYHSFLQEVKAHFVVTACLTALKERAEQLHRLNKLPTVPTFVAVGLDKFDTTVFDDGAIFVLDTPCQVPPVAGVPNSKNAKMVQAQLDIAHQLAIDGKVRAIITAPLAKSVLIEGGVSLDNGEPFSGHTEYFMAKCRLDKVVMMLANSVMKVALVTTHIPLKAVASAITKDEVANTVTIVHRELVDKFGLSTPKILVCGLNPHAGENGHLGDEEIYIINPVLKDFQEEGLDISLALPADTLFTQKYLTTCDAIIAMYHDQGLAPLKSHGFGDTVNITLGLPYVRTSVDHGTAFDLAGTGKASDQSLRQAIRYAIKMNAGQL